MGQRVDGRCVLSGCASGKAIFHLPRSSYQTNLGRRWSESHQESLRASCQEESGAALIARLRRCLGAGVYAGLKLVAYGSSIGALVGKICVPQQKPPNVASLAGAQVRQMRLNTNATSWGDLGKAFPFSLPYAPQFLILIPYAGPRNSRSAGPQFPIARHAIPGSFLTGPGAAQFQIEIPIFSSSYIWASWSIFELYLGVLVEF